MVDNIQLPQQVERGAKGGPRFRTNITALLDGAETRNAEWSRTRAKWDIGYGIQNKTDYSTVLAFFYAREGRNRGFLFKDWSDYAATDSNIGTGDGTNRVFQLRKQYIDTANTHNRKITRPVNGTLTIKVNGVTNVNWSCDYNTGIVTFTPGNAPAAAAVVTASFEFTVPVRFDVDEMELTLEWEGAGSIDSIPVVELKE